jgi:hypothetical protein
VQNSSLWFWVTQIGWSFVVRQSAERWWNRFLHWTELEGFQSRLDSDIAKLTLCVCAVQAHSPLNSTVCKVFLFKKPFMYWMIWNRTFLCQIHSAASKVHPQPWGTASFQSALAFALKTSQRSEAKLRTFVWSFRLFMALFYRQFSAQSISEWLLRSERHWNFSANQIGEITVLLQRFVNGRNAIADALLHLPSHELAGRFRSMHSTIIVR